MARPNCAPPIISGGWARGTPKRSLREELGDDKVEVACCGQAGENLVKFAAVMTMRNRAAGRTGMGAVMGSKKLKAIAVRGKARPEMADTAAVRQIAQAGGKEIKSNRSMAEFGELGTPSVVRLRVQVRVTSAAVTGATSAGGVAAGVAEGGAAVSAGGSFEPQPESEARAPSTAQIASERRFAAGRCVRELPSATAAETHRSRRAVTVTPLRGACTRRDTLPPLPSGNLARRHVSGDVASPADDGCAIMVRHVGRTHYNGAHAVTMEAGLVQHFRGGAPSRCAGILPAIRWVPVQSLLGRRGERPSIRLRCIRKESP